MADNLREIALTIASYEDQPSKAGRATGSAIGGASFEVLVTNAIALLAKEFADIPNVSTHEVFGDDLTPYRIPTSDGLSALSVGDRVMVFRLPNLHIAPTSAPVVFKEELLRRRFKVDEWYNSRLTEMSVKG